MAITNAQQYKQLVNPPMKGKKRPGYRGSDYGDQAKGTGAYSGGPPGNTGGGSTDRSAVGAGSQYSRNKAKAALAEQRKKAIEAITPSTKFSNRVIANALGFATPFGIGKFAFNKAIDKTAMGYGKTPTTTTDDDDDDDDTNRGGDGVNFRETMMAQQFTPFQQDIVENKIEELGPIELALQQRDLMGGPRS